MITIRADNRILLKSAKYSYLATNYLSGVTSLVISNSDGFFPYTIGGSTTQFDITNPTGTTFRYTWDGTGTDPEIGENIQINSQIVIAAANFNAGNNGTFTITAFDTDANWFEVTNASGVVESNKTIGGGSITVGRHNFVLLGEFGSESSEIVEVSSVNKSSHTLTVGTTKFAHSQDTKVYILPYNQIKFFHTSIATFSATFPITGYIDIQADNLYTMGSDYQNTTGFGWYIFYNNITAKASSASNAVPYAGFSNNSVEAILKQFYSLLNQSERKLITDTDAIFWMNAGMNICQTELSLVSKTYYVDSTQSIATISGTQEYDLESDFARIVNVYNSDNEENLKPIDLNDVSRANYYNTGTTIARYYLRGKKIGFVPSPTSVTNYTVRYQYTATVLSSYYDTIDLPGNNGFILTDYMLFKACPKIGRSPTDAKYFNEEFKTNIARLKLGFHKQDDNPESWGIASSANI